MSINRRRYKLYNIYNAHTILSGAPSANQGKKDRERWKKHWNQNKAHLFQKYYEMFWIEPFIHSLCLSSCLECCCSLSANCTIASHRCQFFLRKIDLTLAQHIITHISDQMEYAQSFQYYVGKLFTSYAWRNGFVWIKPFNNATF